MKKLATACAFICMGAPLQAATISGSSFAAVVMDGTSFVFGAAKALGSPTSCDPASGTGCDLSIGAFDIDFVDEKTLDVSLFDLNRSMGGTSSVMVNILALNYTDGSDTVPITDVSFAGAQGDYSETPVVDFTSNSIVLLISNLTDKDFNEGETLRFDITTASSLSAVPLPAGFGLLGLSALGAVALNRRKDKVT